MLHAQCEGVVESIYKEVKKVDYRFILNHFPWQFPFSTPWFLINLLVSNVPALLPAY